ncbi:hypothetical protein BGZ96_007660 [Linnemannia gamsii]|uniref:Uncharacterized protein n=1 Tax=Linnemannia gamsii TaxID=64522 RepID=A0ABQ7KDU3_9FUNG|nr:hypothetical protein BGZ96_007660 [Linnemannia gamsii]
MAAHDDDGTDLAQKYKDKVQARTRGAGTHQPKFRGFSLGKSSSNDAAATTALTDIKDNTEKNNNNEVVSSSMHKSDFKGFSLKDIKSGKPAEQAEPSGRRTTDSGFETTSATTPTDEEPRRSKSRPVPTYTTAPTDTANPRRSTTNTRDSTPSLKDLLAQPSTTIPITPNSTRTRAGSRYTGQSPSFKLAWGKTLVVSETKRQETTQARASGTATPTTSATVATPAAAPVEDNSAPEDYGGMDDFDAGGISPSPPRDAPAPEPAQGRKASTSKRKSPNTNTPEITSAATTTTSATRKPTLVLTKRRRLIQEEADENDEPLPSIEDITTTTPREATNGRMVKPTANTKETEREKPIKALAKVSRTSKTTSEVVYKEYSAKKSGEAEGRKSKTTSSSTTKPAKLAKEPTKQKSGMPLKQTTLMQLNTRLTGKEVEGRSTSLAARSRAVTDDDSDDESDFEKTAVQKQALKAMSGKGPSSDTVKNYKQLQIHCLKFWGPGSAVAKPATIRNKDIAKELPLEGEDSNTATAPRVKKSVQSILHIESAPLSEMDVIAEAVRDVVDTYIESIEDQSMVKELLFLRSELETRLIEQVDMLDDHSLLRASVKKAAAVKKELRVQLLETQRRRQRTRQELAKVRASFEREERVRHSLEETHKFLTDLESLRDEIVGSDGEDSEDGEPEGSKSDSSSQDNVKTGLQSYIVTVGARSGGAGPHDGKDTRPGMLGALVEFNRLLETLVRNTPSKANVSGSDSDSSDYDL